MLMLCPTSTEMDGRASGGWPARSCPTPLDPAGTAFEQHHPERLHDVSAPDPASAPEPACAVLQAPAEGLRHALPHLRSQPPVPLCAGAALYAARCAAGD